jgi:putative lipoic acid-binding regulatory protein
MKRSGHATPRADSAVIESELPCIPIERGVNQAAKESLIIMPSNDSLLEFPCQFPIKVMGLAGQDFDTLVIEIVKRHVTCLDDSAVRVRPSREGKYTAMTVTIEAHSQQHLDAIYIDLSTHERILMVL